MKGTAPGSHKFRLTPLQKRIGLSLIFVALTIVSLLIGVDKNVNIENLLRFNMAALKIFCAIPQAWTGIQPYSRQ